MAIQKIMFLIFKKGIKLLFGHRLSRFYPIKFVYFSLLSHLRDPNSPVNVFDHKMFLDSIDSLGLSIWGVYEPFETELIKKEIKKGDVVLDLGANIGYYTLIFAKIVGKNGKIFAFEPDQTNFSLLKKNVEINRYKNILLIRKAVIDRMGTAKLYLSDYNKGSHSIFNLESRKKFIQVETIRLDDYFKNYNGKIDFIKMDIEGAEGLAIIGMQELLKRNKNLKILTEFNQDLLKNSDIRPEDYLKMLVGQRFKLYQINEKEKKIEFVSVKELLEKCSKGQYTNLLCKR